MVELERVDGDSVVRHVRDLHEFRGVAPLCSDDNVVVRAEACGVVKLQLHTASLRGVGGKLRVVAPDEVFGWCKEYLHTMVVSGLELRGTLSRFDCSTTLLAFVGNGTAACSV